MPRNNAPAEFGQHREIKLDLSLVDVVGMKRASGPAEQMPVFRVLGIGNSLEEFKKPRDTTDVFWRRAPGTIDEIGIVGTGIALSAVLNHDAAPPVVAEVVHIGKAVNSAFNQPGKAQTVGFEHALAGGLKSRHWVAIDLVANSELPKVGVLPPHHGLDDVMQSRQCCARGDVNTPPDSGLDVFEFDKNTQDGFGHWIKSLMMLGQE